MLHLLHCILKKVAQDAQLYLYSIEITYKYRIVYVYTMYVHSCIYKHTSTTLCVQYVVMLPL